MIIRRESLVKIYYRSNLDSHISLKCCWCWRKDIGTTTRSHSICNGELRNLSEEFYLIDEIELYLYYWLLWLLFRCSRL